MRVSTFVFSVYLFTLFGITACTATPTVTIELTPASTQIVPATPLETATATPLLTATPTTTPVAAMVGTLTQVIPLPPEIFTSQLSQDGQALAYTTFPTPSGYPAPGANLIPLRLLDFQSGVDWQVTDDCDTEVCEFAWTSAGQFLWRDYGNLFLADNDGQNRRALAAPEPIVEILGVAPNDTVVARSETHLWRLYLPEGVWDRVPDPLPAPAPVSDYEQQNDRLYLTADGTAAAIAYALTSQTDNFGRGTLIIHLPLAPGAAPTTILPITTPLRYPGYDGPPYPMPIPLAGTPYWLPAAQLDTTTQNADANLPSAFGYHLIDGRNGTLVPLGDVVPLPSDFRIFSTLLSPDREWLVVTGATILPYPAPSENESVQSYLFPTHDFSNGQMVWAHVVGWQHYPPVAFLRQGDYLDDTLTAYALSDRTVTPLDSRAMPGYAYNHIPTVAPVGFVVADFPAATLYAHRADGTPFAAVPLPPLPQATDPYAALFAATETATDDYFYIIIGDAASTSTPPTLWKWDMNP